MRILVDADACPVVEITERVAESFSLPVVLFCDTNHVLHSDRAAVRTVGAGRDAVDLALINECVRGDLVITQDYGVAALALGKGAFALHQDGFAYTDENIEFKLIERHLNGQMRRKQGRHHLKGPGPRTRDDDRRFEAALCKFLKERTGTD